ncbi:thyroid peroxidase-like [Saccostrea echinata]|uniref:thyroid peroxidase-like n=1 Tax=Saccostrea echinata TaxID=191078 RepID=UPI002A817477|nr:thyroid peroxidase-like [Saccostrea echinata]
MDFGHISSILCLLAVFLSTLPDTNNALTSDEVRDYVKKAIKAGEKTLKEYRKELRKFKDKGVDKAGDSSKDELDMISKRKREAEKLSLNGIISIEVTRTLVEQTGMTTEELASHPELRQEFESEFCPDVKQQNCNKAKQSAYRSVDGGCNNIDHPEWGAAITPQPRYLPAEYDDGITSPRRTSKDGSPLPSTRLVSNKLFRVAGNCTETDYTQTLMVMVWGQFIDHDIVSTPVTQGIDGAPITCCGDEVEKREDCFPISIPADDPHFTTGCMNFVRSAPAPPFDGCQPGARENINQITSFIDGGVVYGDSRKAWLDLADTSTGSMMTSEGNMLPIGGTCRPSNTLTQCQLAGDHRVNVVPSLGGAHLVFVREHNRIAEELRKVRPDWGPSKVYQEARKIIGALLQQITYGEYIPATLAESDLVKFNLKLKRRGFSNSYNDSLNPAAKNVFNAAAFRFGHSQIPPTLAYVLRDYMTRVQATPMESTFLDPQMLVTQNGKRVDDLTRFIVTSNGMKADGQFEPAVRDRLFEDANGNSFDLGALNLQRGRDHGLPPYNSWRRWCGLPVGTSFSDLPDISEENRVIFADLYSEVDDIDVYAGGMVEKPVKGASVGPLFSCIIGNQFKDLKDGDRYWYESQGKEGFTGAQLREIRKVKLSKILCDNFGVDPIQPDVFHVPTPRNDWRRCDQLPGIDFSAWKLRSNTSRGRN